MKREVNSVRLEVENKEAIIHDLKVNIFSRPQSTPANPRIVKMEDKLQKEIERTKQELEVYERDIMAKYPKSPSARLSRSSSQNNVNGIASEGQTMETLTQLLREVDE